MKPGRELDALIAEKVMGWTRLEHSAPDALVPAGADPSQRINLTFVPRYSTDISSAWEVVEKLGAEGFSLHLKAHRHENPPKGEEHEAFFWSNLVHREAFASTTPHAICLAALKTVPGVSEGSPPTPEGPK